MTITEILLLALLIGVVAGLRALTPAAVVCWGSHLGWLNLGGTWLAFLHSPISLWVFTIAALGEIVNDKLPKTPARTVPPQVAARAIFGAFTGAALAAAGGASLWAGAIAGIVGALAGTFGGYHVRRWLTVGKGLPDLPVALVEDLIAIGGGLFLVSRF